MLARFRWKPHVVECCTFDAGLERGCEYFPTSDKITVRRRSSTIRVPSSCTIIASPTSSFSAARNSLGMTIWPFVPTFVIRNSGFTLHLKSILKTDQGRGRFENAGGTPPRGVSSGNAPTSHPIGETPPDVRTRVGYRRPQRSTASTITSRGSNRFCVPSFPTTSAAESVEGCSVRENRHRIGGNLATTLFV